MDKKTFPETTHPLLVDDPVTASVKRYALEALNADLVGIADIGRFAQAPRRMRPQGLMPEAKSVVVMAITHLDGSIEIGGRNHPQDIGPYWVQYAMNARLDEMSYRMALFIEAKGFKAAPIASSNIWRYKGYKELTEQFAPDVSHMHGAVAAGLAEFGFNGLALTPEYGARQRYVTVVTDMALTPTPLLEPGSVCDNCMLCRKHCLSGALSKEIDGWKVVQIEDKTYRYANKNLWRCSWGEHFDLDLDLDIPDRVDEQVILEKLEQHGKRGGEMGSCLRYCVPSKSRYFEPEYSSAPRRRRHVSPNPAVAVHRGLFERIRSLGDKYGADFVWSLPAATAKAVIDDRHWLPDAETVVLCGFSLDRVLSGVDDDDVGQAALVTAPAAYGASASAYDMARETQRRGFSALVLHEREAIKVVRAAGFTEATDRKTILYGMLTSAVLPFTGLQLPVAPPPARATLASTIKALAGAMDMTATGIAPAARMDRIVDQLAPVLDGHERVIGRDTAGAHVKVQPEVETTLSAMLKPSDYLPDAQSVIVLGLRMPQGAIDSCARYEAEAVGSYAFALYESYKLMRLAALRIVKTLNAAGHAARISHDLCGTAGRVGNSRGIQPDVFSNRFAAVAAGLGGLTRCGFVLNPQSGAGMRFLSIVTNAELAADPVCRQDLAPACLTCRRCLDACDTGAFGERVAFEIDGVSHRFASIDLNRCDWAKRYSFNPDSGNRYMGWHFRIDPPDRITPEALAGAMRQTPPIIKHHACSFEKCYLACPYTRMALT